MHIFLEENFWVDYSGTVDELQFVTLTTYKTRGLNLQ